MAVFFCVTSYAFLGDAGERKRRPRKKAPFPPILEGQNSGGSQRAFEALFFIVKKKGRWRSKSCDVPLDAEKSGESNAPYPDFFGGLPVLLQPIEVFPA